MREALWLATLLLACIGAQAIVARGLASRMKAAGWRWTIRGASGFVLLNVWVGFAARTALFWAVLGAGAGVENYLQFQLKRILAAEIRTPLRAVLVGSSQTRAQIDENLLNDRIGAGLWTTELHYPGSLCYDLLLVEPYLQRLRPQFVITYFTERNLYTGSDTEVPKELFTFSQLPDASRRGALRLISADKIAYGLLGDALPIFRCREALGQRFLGRSVMNLQQASYDSALDTDMEARARDAAKAFQLQPGVAFQKQALEDFVARCESGGMRVILLAGGMNPVLSSAIDPAIRADMLQFLRDLASRHAGLTVVYDLPVQVPADYEDLSHVTPEAQARFSEFLADYLKNLTPSAK